MDLTTKLRTLMQQNHDLGTLLFMIVERDIDAWLVGGCLRDLLLERPLADIDLVCASDPTSLAKSWATKVVGRWFWLDSQRKQSRVLLKNGLTVDFAPLRASSIIADLQLRDFTINSFAVPLDKSFPNAEILDPLGGMKHLHKRQLHLCSPKSFSDDPLRMLKGIRHAVTLGFTLSAETLQQLSFSAHLLPNIAGERIRDELSKILAAENLLMGIELLINTGLLDTLFGPVSIDWDRQATVDELTILAAKVHEIEPATEIKQSDFNISELFSKRVLFLLAKLLKHHSPHDLSALLHNKLRLSRYQQRLIENLQTEPDTELFSLAFAIEGQRRQALIVEQLEPFSFEKLLYWGVCHNRLTLKRALELQESFTAEQKYGRISALLNGRQIAALLQDHQNYQIGKWQIKLKVAEINGEISTFQQAEKWLKSKLLFDNKEA